MRLSGELAGTFVYFINFVWLDISTAYVTKYRVVVSCNELRLAYLVY